MDENQEKLIQGNRVNIVQDLEPRGQVLDALLEDGVLTENDIELVSSAKTRKERCQLLLKLLPTRGPSAYGSFRRALRVGQYEFLAEKLDILRDPQTTANKTDDISKTCCKCQTFLRQHQTSIKVVNAELSRVLSEQCCMFLDNIEPKDVIDQLFQDGIVNTDDIDNIISRVTRRDRCETLFGIMLSNYSTGVLKSLKTALSKKYGFIVDRITQCPPVQITITRGKIPDIDKHKTEPLPAQSSLTQCKLTDDTLTPITTLPPVINFENDSITFVKYRYANEETNTRDRHPVKPSVTECKHIQGTGTSVTALQPITDLENDSVTFVKLCDPENTNEDAEVKYVKSIKRNDCAEGLDAVDAGVGLSLAIREITEVTSVQKDSPHSEISLEGVGNHDGRMKPIEMGVDKNDSENGTLTEIKQPVDNSELNVNAERKRTASERNSECERIDPQGTLAERRIITKQVSCVTAEQPRKRLTVAFNYLSTLINQGDYVKFESVSSKLKFQFPQNYDLMCILGYLHASRDLFKTDFDSAKSHIRSIMALVPKTSNPRYFMLELFTAKTRMYITQKKLEKLQTTLDEAMMILETDPVGCTGRAAGWLYINHARNKTAQLSCLNLSKPNAFQTYNRLFESAKTSFQRSMTNFKKDGGKDGPFGFGYALCRLVILLLRCGDNGRTMGIIVPAENDVTSAGQYIKHLDDSDVPIPKILDMHFRLAKCDYQFRRNNLVRALEHAQVAFDVATELNMLEFTEHAQNRLSYLRSKMKVVTSGDDMSEEEAHKILFGESCDSESNTQSE